MGSQTVQKAKEFLLSQPLHKALMACMNISTSPNIGSPIPGPGGPGQGQGFGAQPDRPSNTDVGIFIDLARDLLANAVQM